MIIDLLLAVIALGGAAFLGYKLGNQFSVKSFEARINQLQTELTTTQQSLAEANMQLDHCTKRRRAVSKKMADLTAKLEGQETVENRPPAITKPKAPVLSVPKKPVSKQDEVLSRIEAKASQINFERIGRSAAHEKDDLKLIKGVGHFIEKKLNALGIYTFEQVANFNEEDETKVNEAIEFFPGRIKRDAWAKQAKVLKAGKSAV